MFAEIDDRREQVQEAHRETFRWIFQSDHETGFATWLSAEDGIFWIHGKPASGKSTLMKYITQEKRLKELLDVWTGSRPLVVASFYFWVAGSPLQRSLVGLYRTLLHQILKAEEQMCRIAFPDWQSKFSDSEPTLGMLGAAVNKILTSGKLSNNFFFIIDGLDEYDRDSIGKTELAELMLNLVRSPRVKLLLSSRPETPFKTAFHQCPTLRLETLTESDMSAYVNQRLSSNASAMNISESEADSIDRIASFIIDHAQGVFLWVVLTLNIALDGIRNHEDLAIVRDRVMLLPPELDDMFTHILTQRIPQHHRCEAFRCLYITYAWHRESASRYEMRDLSYVVVSVARQASTYAEACMLANSTSCESPQYSRNRLASRCQGLLEASDDEYTTKGVTFLHKTLLDYLTEDQEAQSLLKAGLGDAFDVHTAIMAGLIGMRGRESHTESKMCRVLFHFNTLAERSTGQSRSELLAIFDRVESTIYSDSEGALHDNDWLNRHWSVNLFITQPPLDSNLLVWAAHCGAALFVQESIEKGEIPHVQASSRLLYYALTPVFSDKERHGIWDVEANLAVSALLLDHGADPAYQVEVECPWNLVLRFVVEATRMPRRDFERISDVTAAALRILFVFARSAPDLQKCSALRIYSSADRTFYTASEALDRSVRRRSCCGDYGVRTCQCRRAQFLRSAAMEVLGLVEVKGKMFSKTAENGRMKARRSCIPDIKQIFSPRHSTKRNSCQ